MGNRAGSGTRVIAIAALGLSAVFLLSSARPVPRVAVPRTPELVRQILAQGPHQGECERCHTAHAGDQPEPQEHALIGPDDNTLCDGCHTTPWAGGSYAGTWLYAGSAHGSSSSMIWPGPDPPMRVESDAAGKCVNCHDPHGWTDASGTIPELLNAREESQCLTCHDGQPAATDIRTETLKPFRHPVEFSGRHTGPGESTPQDFGTTPINRRHAECVDCHDPHVARADQTRPAEPEASKTLLGVSRVEVVNGAPGAPPAYVFVPASDTLTATTEYALCFKCHSSWTTQPAGQTDLARVFNANNASYHPVEALGRNLAINPQAFASGWDVGSRTRCDDCHGSDLNLTRGPHGSIYRYILRQPYTASTASRAMASDELCFKCHAWEVYADPQSPLSALSLSRFNRPWAKKGHAEHTEMWNVTCYSCHDSHGSANQPHLIVTGRIPGLISYTATPTGGTCTPTCHASRIYDASGAP